MSDNVRHLAPPNLASIPAMLRHWAAELEAGREPMPATAYLVLVASDDDTPTVCSFGLAQSRLAEAGALFYAASRAVDVDHG